MCKRNLILKILQMIKNYRRISKNISKKSKEKITKDFIKIPKEKNILCKQLVLLPAVLCL